MPCPKMAKLFPLAALSLAVSNAVAVDVQTIPRGNYYLQSSSDQALVIIRSRQPIDSRFSYQFTGVLNLEGNLIVDKGFFASGILFDDANDPDVDINIKSSGSIQILQGTGATITYGRSAFSNVVNKGQLTNKEGELFAISPNNPNQSTTVIGTFTNDYTGVMEGGAVMRIFEGDMNGDFINNGTVKTAGSAGVSLQLGGMSGSVINNGSWFSNGNILWLNDASTFGGNLINNGDMTSSKGLVRISGTSEFSDDTFASFSGSIVNKSFATMTAETGHAFEFRDSAFAGGIVNEVSAIMRATEEEKALVYVSASSDPDSASENEGKISEGVSNAGFMSAHYIAWNDNPQHYLEVTNASSGLMFGRFLGQINLTNSGLLNTMRGANLTGNFVNEGVLELAVDAEAATTPVMQVSGDVSLGASSTVVVAPIFELYSDDEKLHGEQYKLIGAGTLINSGATVDGTVLMSIDVVDTDDQTLTISLDRRTPEEVASDSESVESLVEAAEKSKSVYDVLANTTSQAQLKKLVRENWINNTHATQQLNLIVQQEATSIPFQRLSTARSFARGVSFGDKPASQGIWMQMLATDASQDSRRNDEGETLTGFDAEANGFSLGYEQGVEKGHYDLTYGAAITAADVKADKQNSIDQNRINNYQLTVYGSYNWNQWYLDGVLNYGRSKHERMRYVEVEGVSQTPIEADFNSNHYGLKLLAGFNQPYWNMMFQPLIGFNYSRIVSEDYKEKDTGGTGLAQAVSSQTYQKVELGAGFEMSRIFKVARGELEPSIRAMAWHDFKGDQIETTSRYLVGSQEFSVKGAEAVKDSYSFSFNLTYRREDNLSFVVGYDRNQKTNYKSDNYYFRLKYDF